MLLFLDTSGADQTALYLVDAKSIRAHAWPSGRTQQETLHGELAKFMKKCRVPLAKVSKVGAVVGPGSFSRVRTGVVTANTLAYALGIPAVGYRKSGPVEDIDFRVLMKDKGGKSLDVYYDRAPNITKPKKP
jgi:tRNA A37 threonylcarbamoyladenosine modification protein TsaB